MFSVLDCHSCWHLGGIWVATLILLGGRFRGQSSPCCRQQGKLFHRRHKSFIFVTRIAQLCFLSMMQHTSAVRACNSRTFNSAFHFVSRCNRPIRCDSLLQSTEQRRGLFQVGQPHNNIHFGSSFLSENHLPRSFTNSRLHLSSKSGGDQNQSSSSSSSSGKKKSSQQFKKPKSNKWKVNPNAGQANADALAKAFADLAAKDGFDSSTAYFADTDKVDSYADTEVEDVWLDHDESALKEGIEGKKEGLKAVALGDDEDNDLEDDDMDDDEIIAKMNEEFDDEDDIGDEEFDDDEDYLDMNDEINFVDDDDNNIDDMEARIVAARRDRDRGRVSVPKALDELSPKIMRELGFRREANPFGNDETPRRQVRLITNVMSCSACGADFQSGNEQRPGYLPPEKFDIQVKLSKIEELQRLQEKAESLNWSSEDEVDWLIRASAGGKTDGSVAGDSTNIAELDIDAVAEEMGLDLVELSKKKVICKRCHGLQNFGKVEESLRPGWTDEPLLSQEAFRNMLRPIREKTAVIVALVDLFDFAGSVLPELDAIAGDNPVILAANKADLLPSQMGQARAESWVRRELEYLGVKSIANIGGAVRLVSCKTGFGVSAMLAKARQLAEELDCDVYVVGAANAGKSTLINHILERSNRHSYPRKTEKIRAGNLNARRGAITTSPLPGTTLKFIKIDLGGGKSLYDTPGLLVPGSLTQLLTPEELKIVMPKNQVEPITFRIEAGKCVLVGALAKVELIGDCKPFLFTFFVANGIKLHPTDSSRAEKVVAEHVGGMLTPPLSPGPERLQQIGEFTSHDIEIEGTGWKQAAADISLRGLGWVAVTGAGTANIRITVPKPIGVSVRPPLMPFDIWEATAKYTGARAVRKSAKSKSGKRRKGVGRN